MKIIIDVMSGDNAPLELVKGALMAKNTLGVDVIAVGNEEAQVNDKIIVICLEIKCKCK